MHRHLYGWAPLSTSPTRVSNTVMRDLGRRALQNPVFQIFFHSVTMRISTGSTSDPAVHVGLVLPRDQRHDVFFYTRDRRAAKGEIISLYVLFAIEAASPVVRTFSAEVAKSGPGFPYLSFMVVYFPPRLFTIVSLVPL